MEHLKIFITETHNVKQMSSIGITTRKTFCYKTLGENELNRLRERRSPSGFSRRPYTTQHYHSYNCYIDCIRVCQIITKLFHK